MAIGPLASISHRTIFNDLIWPDDLLGITVRPMLNSQVGEVL